MVANPQTKCTPKSSSDGGDHPRETFDRFFLFTPSREPTFSPLFRFVIDIPLIPSVFFSPVLKTPSKADSAPKDLRLFLCPEFTVFFLPHIDRRACDEYKTLWGNKSAALGRF
ncbi:hypothetical protein [Leptospirillum ferriphilum]|uniref:hypothetical protein n=1 Tax=Leptospirillum ferriphilum TaxID=178606 RepID=UPI001939A515|nr:hypothetical protein [Leptospirillum ferriphilum]